MLKPVKCILNHSHPLVRGLVLATPFSDYGNDSPLDLAGYLSPTGINVPGWSISKYGIVSTTNGSNEAWDYGSASQTVVDATQGISGAILCKFGATRATMMAKRNGTATEWQLYSYQAGNGFVVNCAGSELVCTTDTIAGWYLFGFSIEPTGGTAYGYKDGVLINSGSHSVATRRDINVSIGARWGTYPGTAAPSTLEIAVAYVWQGRVLSGNEHQLLATDPFALIRLPRRIPVMVPYTPPDGPPVGAAVLNQFGFLWRLDDDVEDAATAAKPENEMIVTEQGVSSKRRLRVGVKNTGGPVDGEVRLQLRKQGYTQKVIIRR